MEPIRTILVVALFAASGCSVETAPEPAGAKPELIVEAELIYQILAGKGFTTSNRGEGESFCANGSWGAYSQGVDLTGWRGRWRIVQDGRAIPEVCIDRMVDLNGARRAGEICRRLVVQNNPLQLVTTRLGEGDRLPLLLYLPVTKPAECRHD